MTTEVVQLDPRYPSSCCFLCGVSLKAGDLTELKTVPLVFRWGKQRKKAKGNTYVALRVHVGCDILR